jgi:hypothetical protein
MRERRRYRRFPIAYPLECSDGKGKKELLLVDISENGLAFTSSGSLDEKKELDLYIFLKKKMFNLKAAVIHAGQKEKGKPFSIGARFLNATEDFRKNLTREIEDIKQFCRESNLYHNNNLSVRQASSKYLSDEKKYS